MVRAPERHARLQLSVNETPKQIARDKGISLAGIALARVKSYPGINTVLMGPKHKGQLDVVREAMNCALKDAEVAGLQELFQNIQ